MFYCDECGRKRGWPVTIVKSVGPCEICNRVGSCNDVPSSKLPLPAGVTEEGIKEQIRKHRKTMGPPMLPPSQGLALKKRLEKMVSEHNKMLPQQPINLASVGIDKEQDIDGTDIPTVGSLIECLKMFPPETPIITELDAKHTKFGIHIHEKLMNNPDPTLDVIQIIIFSLPQGE
jgi:hypothetical protein